MKKNNVLKIVIVHQHNALSLFGVKKLFNSCSSFNLFEYTNEIKRFILSFYLLVLMSLSAVTQPHLYLDLSGNWQFKTDSQNRGEQEGWFEQDYDDSAWDKIPVPGFWERHGYQGYNGYAWYRTEIEVPESFRNQPVYLALGGMDDAFDMWIDGQHLGHFGDQDANETYYLRKSVHDLTDVLQPGRH
ncbi:hypothetical protein GWN26_10395, partial [Candidatus Saccharibacteria bacterium]|nr:hypothetical protein [Calditrichia bacterium]NIV72539.1 hypothetical protein [Calditrichia bacterium]NIV99508.1 hypothetical protein [Candidatus Saccharibacteria bacterium]NIW79958.1 hypothetical protein [Calditrichia bacterium]